MTDAVSTEAEDTTTGGPWIPTSSVAAATWALFLGLALVMMGNGLNGSVLGVRSERADVALYRSKNDGRNRVTLSGTEEAAA